MYICFIMYMSVLCACVPTCVVYREHALRAHTCACCCCGCGCSKLPLLSGSQCSCCCVRCSASSTLVLLSSRKSLSLKGLPLQFHLLLPVCVCMCVHVCICIFVWYTCVVYSYMHICMCVYIHVCMCVWYIHVCVHKCVCVWHIHIYICVYTYMHICVWYIHISIDPQQGLHTSLNQLTPVLPLNVSTDGGQGAAAFYNQYLFNSFRQVIWLECESIVSSANKSSGVNQVIWLECESKVSSAKNHAHVMHANLHQRSPR